MTRHRRVLRVVLSAALLTFGATGARAQSGREPKFGYRGLFEVAPQTFTATNSFDAVFGKSSGLFLGGGGQLRWNDLLVEVTVSRFKDTGQRVFVSGGEVFHLGIPTTITLRPVELTAAYRLPRLWRFRPYAGGGFGKQQYRESSTFAAPGEDVEFSENSYHALGGAEVRLWRWLATAAEVRHRSAGNAIGKGGVSKEFGEDNLGGTSVRVRFIVIGR